MARQGISTGTIPNDGTGDTLLSGAIKINQNFSEVYGLIGDGTNAYVGIVTQIVAGSNISISTSYGSVTVTSTASGGGESYWTQNSTGINTTSNVGIGTYTVYTGGISSSFYFGSYSWGKIDLGSRTNPISLNFYGSNGVGGISTSGIIRRVAPLKINNYL